jgi:hypothetical protein
MAQPETAHAMQTAIAIAHLEGVGLGIMGATFCLRTWGCGQLWRFAARRVSDAADSAGGFRRPDLWGSTRQSPTQTQGY